MKKFLLPALVTTSLFISCSGDKVEDVRTDSVPDSIIANSTLNDSTKQKFRRLVTALPVPFEILNRFSGAHLPFKSDLPNSPENSAGYTSGTDQAVNLGIYGADLAYLISQDKLAESAPYLKCIRKISDNIVVPSAFDGAMMQRYESNQNRKDSLQMLINSSYKKIDSTLQSNDRLVLASLVIYGGWLESMYITTQHIGKEQQNEKNKVLFDMLTMQRPYFDNITELLASFPDDSTCAWLHRDMIELNGTFPTAELSPEQFSARLQVLSTKVAATRNKLIKIQ